MGDLIMHPIPMEFDQATGCLSMTSGQVLNPVSRDQTGIGAAHRSSRRLLS